MNPAVPNGDSQQWMKISNAPSPVLAAAPPMKVDGPVNSPPKRHGRPAEKAAKHAAVVEAAKAVVNVEVLPHNMPRLVPKVTRTRNGK